MRDTNTRLVPFILSIVATADALAYKLKKLTLTSDILMLSAIQKWDGRCHTPWRARRLVLPAASGLGQPCPTIARKVFADASEPRSRPSIVLAFLDPTGNRA
jgi:hypothetical protein